jgi:hypothetical protein
VVTDIINKSSGLLSSHTPTVPRKQRIAVATLKTRYIHSVHPVLDQIILEEGHMILYRSVFQAKFGKADDLVAAFKNMNNVLTDAQMESLQPRILTDISGSFDTVVLETTHESLAALEQFRIAMFSSPETSAEASPVAGLIESGRNEYYTIES